MLLSREYLMLSQSANSLYLYYVLCSRDYRSIITHCQYSDPNYGSCWFRVKVYPLGSAREVMVRAVKQVAWELCWHSDLYYEAMRCAVLGRLSGCAAYLNPMFSFYTTSFHPEYRLGIPKTESSQKKMVLLFGTSQIEA